MKQTPLMQVLLVFLAGTLVIGTIYSLNAAADQDSRLRSQMLTDTRIVSAGLLPSEIETLVGDERDLKNPLYLNMKSFLERAENARERTKFVYLMRQNEDGQVIILIDSEKAGSKDYSPPGEVYTNATPALLHSFQTGEEVTEGPVEDSWGTVVSALIPLNTSSTRVTILGMDVSAEEWSKQILDAVLLPVLVTILVSVILICIIVVQYVLEKKERRILLLLRDSNDIIMIMGRDKTVTFANDAVLPMLGIRTDEIIGTQWSDERIHPDDKPRLHKMIDELCTRPQHADRIVFKYQSVENRWVHLEVIATNRLNDPEINGIIINIRDVTKFKEMEQEIQEYLVEVEEQNQSLTDLSKQLSELNEDLEVRVTERTRELVALHEQMRERTRQIEHLSDQKDLFLYQLGHDLRTPLTPIIGMGGLLLEGIQDPDARELVQIFLSSVEYLQKMTEDILTNANLNKIHAFQSYENFDLNDLISDAIGLNQYLADAKGLTIINSVKPGITVSFSKPYAKLVFRNLINNAIKFNSPRGTVTIQTKSKRDTISVSVSDTGIGIAPEIQDKIWDEFYTGDSARKDPFAKGFGLGIVKKIVEMHNGTIEVYSEGYLKGAVFTVHLPKTQEGHDTWK